MTEQLRSLVAALTDEQFEQLYGPLGRLRPEDAAALFDGFDAPWWIVGGWAIEAFTGEERAHDDLDASILASELPRLIEHFGGSHHLWAAGGGMLFPVLSVDQELPGWAQQIWIRETSTGPWLLDVILAPDRDGQWVFRRDPTVVADLDTVTWAAHDGLVYQRPEITLAFKAAHARAKDSADLQAALPRLSSEARQWLRETIGRLHPDHRWLALL